ncbi:MAG TPA: MFS transporter [Geothrix sp.]|nr:MFS transporter [Geothrix sp.]
MTQSRLRSVLNLTVLVAALGYFVDMFDLLLFPILRQQSLASLGIPIGAAQIGPYALLLNAQMIGMLLGGIFWGILGDRKGRLSTLFGSIALYSVANLANAYVTSIEAYALWRFIAGFGLAGELGAAVTLVAEVLPKELRGYGTALVAGVGVFGTVVAVLVGRHLSWQHAYLVGGGLGILLLFLRVGIRESLMFKQAETSTISRGDFFSLFTSRERFSRYARCILIGLPTWFTVGILVNLSDQFGPLLGVKGKVDPAVAVACMYCGITAGSLFSGFLSQAWGTRTRVVGIFIGAAFLGVMVFLLGRGFTPVGLYVLSAYLGLATGYWAVFVTMAAEQFGTNLRATVATTAPNFVRGSVVLITTSFVALKGHVGMLAAAWIVGIVCYGIAAISLSGLEDTHGRDLDFVE